MTRILVAEDEARIVSFLEKGLRAGGYSTVAVTTGSEALAIARDDAFDLLILDLGLPEIDGHTVLRGMRARGERMPVIILTARDGVDDTVQGLEGGADDYVSKPFQFEELLARIRLRLRDVASRVGRRTARRVDQPGVRAARDLPPPSGPRLVARAAPVTRVGL